MSFIRRYLKVIIICLVFLGIAGITMMFKLNPALFRGDISYVSRETCEKVKKMWDQGDFTARFPGYFETKNLCQDLYYGGQYWVANPSSVDQNFVARCEQIKQWWDQGNFTDRHPESVAQASECEQNYWGGLWYVAQFQQAIEAPSQTTCSQIKKWWDQGDFTRRYPYAFDLKNLCQDAYYGGQYWVANPSSVDQNFVARCEQIKQWWDQGNFTDRHPESVAQASECEQNYWGGLWYVAQFQQAIEAPSQTTCSQIKKWWDQGDFTRRYPYAFDLKNLCQDAYYGGQYWVANPSSVDQNFVARCEQIKQWWDQGNFTSRHPESLAQASECADNYWGGLWYVNNSQTVTIPPTRTKPIPQKPKAGYEEEVAVAQPTINPFKDTNLSTLEGKAAADLFERGIVGGYPDGTFKGTKTVNRAEAAKFLLLARYGSIQNKPNNGQFSDVKEGEWYVQYVVNAADFGIIEGYPDGTFKPADPVNTVEFVKMLALTFGLPTNLPYNYSDVSSDAWYAPYAGVASKYNLFPKRSNNLLPANELTREEVVVAIYQYLNNK